MAYTRHSLAFPIRIFKHCFVNANVKYKADIFLKETGSEVLPSYLLLLLFLMSIRIACVLLFVTYMTTQWTILSDEKHENVVFSETGGIFGLLFCLKRFHSLRPYYT